MPTPKPLPHREVFERLGETQVRFEFAGRSDEVGRAADAWLAEQRAEAEAAAAAKRDAREEETLSIARQARSEARRANNIAITAMILTAIVTICQMVYGSMF